MDRALFEYQRWLVSLVDNEENELYIHYSSLMRWLFDHDYEPKHRLDRNRAADGVELRDRFDDNFGVGFGVGFDKKVEISNILVDKRCSFLECFVALSVKFSENVVTEPGEKSVAPQIFYEILRNLDLILADDEHFSEEKVYKVYVLKKYFSIKHTPNMDLWSQCGKWVYANFC